MRLTHEVEGPRVGFALKMDSARRSHDNLQRKLLDEPVVPYASTGSFDCVAVRCADCNFVQDDNTSGMITTAMLPFKLIYSDAYYLPIGDHVFPAEKYRRVRDRLIALGIAEASSFLEPQPAGDQDILLVHTPEYVQKLKTGTLSPREEMEMEVPYSRDLVEAFWLAAGGSILAAQQSLTDKVSISIGGGFHHAFPDHGEGFCMIHDVAVAIRRLQHDAKIRTAMTVDCDVHQGNGTATIFAGTRTASAPLPSSSASTVERPAGTPRRGRMHATHAGDVFTISLHQHNNYPLYKPPSSIDVDLPDGTGDDDYLAWLDNALSSGLRQFEPDLICYVAGADPYKEDQLGGLGLTIDGLKKRDELVFRAVRTRDIPVMVTFAGGYALNVEDTVTIHCNTVAAAKEVFAVRS
jgi:acetoin utilization deacetylase AcuC-like enzyme